MSAKETFSADWLSLREPADHAARSPALAKVLDQHFSHRDRIEIADLGTGQGSNLRWLAPRLSPEQHWRLVDHDADLLARAMAGNPVSSPHPQLSLEALELDLGSADLTALARCDLVTGSALLDLVSERWIEALAQACSINHCAAFFALSVTGEWRMIRPDGDTIKSEEDNFAQEAFNIHQARDKGLGAALGPGAADFLAQAFAARSFRVDCRSSNWRLPANHPSTLKLGPALLDGWRQAAGEQSGSINRIEDWHARRREELLAGQLGLEVGHTDCLALPPQ